MKISAQNVLRGKVKSITRGGATGQVVITVADGVEIVALIGLGAINDLKLEAGKEAFAVFPESCTMVAVPHSKRGE